MRVEFRAATKNVRESNLDSLLKTSTEFCEKLRRLLPGELENQFIDNLSATSFLQSHWDLRELVIDKKMLETVIESFQHAQEKGLDTDFSFGSPSQSFGFGGFNIYSFNKDTTIKLVDFRVLDLLKEHKIPVSRVRECPICSRIFCAKKLNAKTCGDKTCVNKLSGKKYQTDNKEEINKKKRIKYYNDNGIAYCPKCFFRAGEWCECNTPSRKRSKNNVIV